MFQVGEVYSATSCTYVNDEYMTKRQKKCYETFGAEWSCSSNKCVRQAETTSLNKSWKTCNTVQDTENRQRCYDKVTYDFSDLSEIGNSSKMTSKEKLSAGISAAYVTKDFLSKKAANSSSPCLSKKMFSMGAKVHLVSTAYNKYTSKKKTADFEEEMNDRSIEGSEYDLQYRSIEFYKKQRTLVRDIANSTKTANLISAGIFLGASAVALLEVAMIKTPACSGVSTGGGTQIPENNLGSDEKGIIGKSIGSSTGIAAMGLMMAGLSYKLSSAAKDQSERSEEEIKRLDDLLKRFETASSAQCTSEQRENISGGEVCYCSNEDGTPNSNRTNSTMCTNYWNDQNKNYMVASSDYSSPSVIKNVKVCVNKRGQADPKCICKRQLDKNNENACMKISMNSNNLGNIGSALGFKSSYANLDNLTNGSSTFASLNDNGNIGKQALTNKRLFDGTFKKVSVGNATNKNWVDPLNPKLRKSVLKKFANKMPEGKTIFGTDKLNNNELPILSSNVDALVDDIVSKSNKLGFTGGSALRRRTTKTNGSDDYQNGNFSSNNFDSREDRDKFEFRDKPEIPDSEVSSEKGKNLFRMIHARYVKTAWPILLQLEEVDLESTE